MLFFKNLFKKPILRKTEAGYIEEDGSSEEYMEFVNHYNETALEFFAARLAMNYIADSISICEFRVFNKNKEEFGDDFYRLNIKPNVYQTAAEFRRAIATALLSNGEVLIIEHLGQLILADSFMKDASNSLDPVFRQVKIFDSYDTSRSYSINEVIYIRYSDNGIQGFLQSLLAKYNELLSVAAENFKTLGGQKGILEISALEQGNENFLKNFEKITNDYFKKFYKSRNAVLPLFEGYKYTPQKNAEYKEDGDAINGVNSIKDNALALAASAFKIPVGLLKGDIANNEELVKSYIMFCLNPFAELIGQGFCRALISSAQYKSGFYLYLDTTRAQITNVFTMSEKIDKLFSDGVYSVDELRRKFREPELDTKASKAHYTTKNYQNTNPEGGDSND